MLFKENSLFGLLLRSPWWASALLAVLATLAMRFFVPTMYAVAGAAPFIAIALWVSWKQLREPGAARLAKALERLRAMPADEFAAAVEAGFRREGYTVKRLERAPADFELVQGERSTLVASRRWKAAHTGVEPLRELEAARLAREAHEAIYLAAGGVTAQARAFAAQKRLRLIEGPELAKKFGVGPQ